MKLMFLATFKQTVGNKTSARYEVLLNIPTLTDVLASSSEALLPPGLLLMLMRLELRAGRKTALIGRDCDEYDCGEEGVGDAGDPAIVYASWKDKERVYNRGGSFFGTSS